MAFPKQLEHVYWIGGGSCAGKSTIANRLAAQLGLRVYATDDMMADHARRSSPADSPLLHSFMAMDMDERWVNRSPQTMLNTFHWFRGEGFKFIIDDLISLPREPGVIVEGFRVLPELVNSHITTLRKAVWLLPTPQFRRSMVESRAGTVWGFLGKTSNPEKALCNLLERDRLFTERVREETKRLGLPAIDVDNTTTADDLVQRVGDLFGLTAN